MNEAPVGVVQDANPPRETVRNENPLAQQWRGIRDRADGINERISSYLPPAEKRGVMGKAQNIYRRVRHGSNERAELQPLSGEFGSIRSLMQQYKQFAEDLEKDPTAREEIRTIYFQSLIKPQIDQAIAEKGWDNAQQAEFQRRFDEISSKGSIQDIAHPVWKFLDAQEINRPEEIYSFRTDDYEQSTTALVLDFAMNDLRRIRDSLKGKFPENDQVMRRLLESLANDKFIVDTSLTPHLVTGFIGASQFPRTVCNYLGQEEVSSTPKYAANFAKNGRIAWWQAMKNARTYQDIFGDTLFTADSSIYRDLLETQQIEALQYYPSPDSVRNLVILATNDIDAFYKVSTKAFTVLNKFSMREDWEELLDSTREKYPLLANAISILQERREVGYELQVALQDASHDFVRSLIREEEAKLPQSSQKRASKDDPNYSTRESLYKALPLPQLLSLLTEKEVISADNAQVFQSALNRLDEIPQKDFYNEFRFTIKGFLLRQLGFNQDLRPQHDDPNMISKFNLLAQRITAHQKPDAGLAYLVSKEVADNIYGNSQGSIPVELILELPSQAPLLLGKDKEGLRAYIFNNRNELLHNPSDFEFINTMVGEFSKKAEPLIRGYRDCLKAGVITPDERNLVLEFARQFKVVAPGIIQGYKEAKLAGHETVYIAELRSLAEKMITGGVIDSDRQKPYFADLLKHVYPNNSEGWATYESIASCADRTRDLEGLVLKPRYEIDLLSQGAIRIKTGEELDEQVKTAVQAPIFAVAEQMGKTGYDNEKVKQDLDTLLTQRLDAVVAAGGLQGINMSAVTTQEDKLFLVLADSLYGTRSIDPTVIKNLLITYEFAHFEDIRAYIAGTTDRVSQAANQDYALLCEVGNFYSDRIKEVNRRLVESAWNNPEIARLMPEYFRKLAQERQTERGRDVINRLQIGRLGLADSFVQQIQRTLRQRGRDYSPEQVREIISKYEALTGGLSASVSTARSNTTRAFYGQLRSQRERTFEAIRTVTGENIDPASVHLGEIDLQSIIATEGSIREGRYDDDQFAAYTAQRFIDLFDDERTAIQKELDKFESESGSSREIVWGHIVKNKDAAHARMVAGVCVSGDNPVDKNRITRSNNMWDMSNHFEFVLQDPETLQCQGALLLHTIDRDGKKMLAASLNPSSTYLYSVDEVSLFQGIMGQLEEFATNNQYDMIIFSNNKTIRTNRTGGVFERSMDERVAAVNKTVKFDPPEQFSFNPQYMLQNMDVVWERAQLS